MEFFDLHCDTPFRMYREKLSADSDRLDTPLGSLEVFDDAVQVFAVWSDRRKSAEESRREFYDIMANLENEVSKNSLRCIICGYREELDIKGKVKLIPAVEDSKILCGELSELKALYDRGVRVLTITWGGENCSGGAHDTEKGLTPFGKALVTECESLGIIADTSHMSEKSFWDTISVAKRPVIASHSNSAHICPHTRNLSDIQFRTLSTMGGLVGINLYPPFVSPKFENSSVGADADEYFSALCRHIEHFLSLGGEKCICLGGDRDGIGRIAGYTELRFIDRLYEKLTACGVKDTTIKDIFSGNAKRFFSKNLPSAAG